MTNTLRLGIFIVATLCMLAVGTYLIGSRQFVFSKTFRVTTNFKNVTGLIEGAEVRIGGIPKGVVKHIELPEVPTGEMTVEMDIDRSAHRVLRADSVATIGSEGLLGSKFVDISFGSEKAPALADNAAIPSTPPVDIADLMKQAGEAFGDARGQIAQVTTKAAEGAAAFSENMEAMRHNFFLKGFFNDRGYEDSTKLRDHLITRLPRGQAMRTFTFDVRKIFEDVDHAKLRNEKALSDAGKYLEATPFSQAVVVAAAGMKGDSQELEVMLQARSWVVRDYLVRSFRMNDTRVKTMTRGKGPDTTTDDGTVTILVYR